MYLCIFSLFLLPQIKLWLNCSKYDQKLPSSHSLSVQVLLCGSFKSPHRCFFWGRCFGTGVYLLIFDKYSTCLIKKNQQYLMTALVDLKDRPPKTLLASLPGNLGVGTRCIGSCSHTSYRWLQKRKSNPHCTQTFNENCIKSWTGWNNLQDQTCLLYRHEDSKSGWILCVLCECVISCTQPRVTGGIQGLAGSRDHPSWEPQHWSYHPTFI